MQRRQRGFTLVEIAIVLVVIGLLLGGVLKGQELINSSRVRAISDQQAGIQAAYYGFQDRFRAVAGDMDEDDAYDAIGEEVFLGGDGNGRLNAPGDDWAELNGVWEQLSKSGFIQGSFSGEPVGSGDDPASNPPTSDHAPINAFNSPLILARDDGYQDSDDSSSTRLVLYMGRSVPVDIARELDVKTDDGQPLTGTLRDAETGGDAWNSTDGEECVNDDGNWDIEDNSQGCNPTFLF